MKEINKTKLVSKNLPNYLHLLQQIYIRTRLVSFHDILGANNNKKRNLNIKGVKQKTENLFTKDLGL